MQKESLRHRIAEGLNDMCYIWAKETRALWKDEGVLLFCAIVPFLYPLLYSFIYNNETVKDVPVCVVDMSHSNTSRKFIRMVDASPNTKVAYYCNNIDEARQLLGKQVAHGIIYFPDDFETKLYRNEQSQVGVYCDMSLMLNYKNVYQTSQTIATEINSQIQLSQGTSYTKRDEELSSEPLALDEVPMFNPAGGYGTYLLPAVLIIIIQQTLMLGIGLAAGTSREHNRYQELVPVSRHYNGIFRIVLGKSLCYFMIYAIVTAFLTIIIPRMFHFTALGSGSALFWLMVPYLLACIFFGLALSCLVRYRENVFLLVVFTSVPILFMTGVSWPQISMPTFWRGVSWLFPSTFGASAFVKINSMGATLAEVRHEYNLLWTQVIIYFFAACLVYRFQIMQTHRRARKQIEELRNLARNTRLAKQESR